ncbi:MAG: type II secretion system F family protein [Pseudomonadales bacterium]|nr:type II secretion system F family protein [Pseudomonadales bacterium]
MELDFSVPLAFIREHQALFIILVTVVFCTCVFFIFAGIGRDFFNLYRRNFFTQVDKNLRDALIVMEPGQIFIYTMATAFIIGPLLFFTMGFLVAATVVGIILVLPPIILGRLKEKRADQFVKQLPDALAAMSSSLRSGLNLVKSLQQIVKNQPNPISQEFAQVLVEYRIGTDLNESFDSLAKRMDRQEIILMNSAIKISRAVGGNLAETFDILAGTLREKSKVESKIKALTSMGRAQGQLATFFPVFIGYVFYKLEPESMAMLFTTKLGLIWLAVMVAMAICAAILINKVVTVDV